MIALLVLLALVFAWACVATAVAVANDRAAKVWHDAADEWKLTAEASRDRLQASSLSEFYAARQIAMQPADQAPQQEWDYDETGLVRSPRAPRDPDAE